MPCTSAVPLCPVCGTSFPKESTSKGTGEGGRGILHSLQMKVKGSWTDRCICSDSFCNRNGLDPGAFASLTGQSSACV